MAGIIKKYYEDSDIIISSAAIPGASTDLSDTADLTYNADTDVSSNGWVLDEDTMSSDSNTKVPTQQSVKAYVDTNAGGLDNDQISRLMLRPRGRINPNSDYVGAATTMDIIGLMNSVAFTDSTAVNGIDANGVYFEQTSSVSGADYGWNNTYDNTRIDHLPLFKFAFQLPNAITNLRFFVGLANMTALADISDVDDFGLEAVGFQYSTGRSDTTFQALTDDGTTQTLTDTGVTVTAATFYEFEIDVTSTSSFTLTIRNAAGTTLGTPATMTTNLPGATVGLRTCGLINPQAAQAHLLRIYQGYLVARVFGDTV